MGKATQTPVAHITVSSIFKNIQIVTEEGVLIAEITPDWAALYDKNLEAGFTKAAEPSEAEGRTYHASGG